MFNTARGCRVAVAQGFLAIALIGVGVGFICWPVALIVVGCLLLIDRIT
jgi:hypothetical protein